MKRFLWYALRADPLAPGQFWRATVSRAVFFVVVYSILFAVFCFDLWMVTR